MAENIKLLVLDDEPDVCDIVELMFKKEGLDIYSALNGEEALKIFQEQRPQIVLIDIKLGQPMDGIGVLRRIKEIDHSTYCIMVTRIDDTTTQETSKFVGADLYLVKPNAIDELKGAVLRQVEKIKIGK